LAVLTTPESSVLPEKTHTTTGLFFISGFLISSHWAKK
jgi:hypothetical protein